MTIAALCAELGASERGDPLPAHLAADMLRALLAFDPRGGASSLLDPLERTRSALRRALDETAGKGPASIDEADVLRRLASRGRAWASLRADPRALERAVGGEAAAALEDAFEEQGDAAERREAVVALAEGGTAFGPDGRVRGSPLVGLASKAFLERARAAGAPEEASRAAAEAVEGVERISLARHGPLWEREPEEHLAAAAWRRRAYAEAVAPEIAALASAAASPGVSEAIRSEIDALRGKSAALLGALEARRRGREEAARPAAAAAGARPPEERAAAARARIGRARAALAEERWRASECPVCMGLVGDRAYRTCAVREHTAPCACEECYGGLQRVRRPPQCPLCRAAAEHAAHPASEST